MIYHVLYKILCHQKKFLLYLELLILIEIREQLYLNFRVYSIQMVDDNIKYFKIDLIEEKQQDQKSQAQLFKKDSDTYSFTPNDQKIEDVQEIKRSSINSNKGSGSNNPVFQSPNKEISGKYHTINDDLKGVNQKQDNPYQSSYQYTTKKEQDFSLKKPDYYKQYDNNQTTVKKYQMADQPSQIQTSPSKYDQTKYYEQSYYPEDETQASLYQQTSAYKMSPSKGSKIEQQNQTNNELQKNEDLYLNSKATLNEFKNDSSNKSNLRNYQLIYNAEYEFVEVLKFLILMEKQLDDIKHNAIMELDYQIDNIHDFFSKGQLIQRKHIQQVMNCKLNQQMFNQQFQSQQFNVMKQILIIYFYNSILKVKVYQQNRIQID